MPEIATQTEVIIEPNSDYLDDSQQICSLQRRSSSSKNSQSLDAIPTFKVLSDEEVSKLKPTPKAKYYRELKKHLKQQKMNKLLLEKEIKHQKALENKKLYFRKYMKNYNKMRYKYDKQFRENIKTDRMIKYHLNNLED